MLLLERSKLVLVWLRLFKIKCEYSHPILAGICRNALETNTEPPLITEEYISNETKNISYPKEFREKARYFLKLVYDKGRKDFIEMKFTSGIDYPLCYANDHKEFSRIGSISVITKTKQKILSILSSLSGSFIPSSIQ